MTVDSACEGSSLEPAVMPLIACLTQLRGVVMGLTAAQYTQQPGERLPGTVGGHVRHILDHANALVEAAATGHLCYDNRQRGTDVETSRDSALASLNDLIGQLGKLPTTCGDRPMDFQVMMASDAEPLRLQTTFVREAAFVLSHTIHHNALLGVLIHALGAGVPDDFGYAPSTLAYLQQDSCAPSR